MILFILKRKWKLYFRPVTPAIIVRLCFALLAIILPYILSGVLYQLSIDRSIDIDSTNIFISINRLSIILPVVFYFFPSIKYKEHLFQTYHPVSIFRKSFIELAVSIFSKTLIYIMSLAILIVFILFKDIDIFLLFDLFVFVITGILLAELLLTSFYLEKKYLLPVAIALLGLAVYYLDFILQHKIAIAIAGFLLILNFFLGIYYNLQGKHITTQKSSLLNNVPLLLRIMINNGHFRTIILTSIILQSLFTFIAARYALPEIPYIKFYLVIPITIYTYCYNNLWGFFPSLAINYVLSGKHVKDFAFLFLKLLFPILIICQATCILAFYLAGYTLTLRIVAGVIAINTFSFIVGFWFSLLSMRKIENVLSFDTKFNNSNLTPTYIVGVTCLLFEILSNYNFAYTLLFASIIVLIVLISYALCKHSSFFLNKFKTKFAEQ